ncbi:carboxypeptidase-like regulatory domain-containing protein [Alteromonas mediterranea]|uniref:carboxypeptidase-like regulatory domain-containing protein n=1 Tax=Alteromonas mediterranea TaxID=314275 RepID=UPI002FE03E96
MYQIKRSAVALAVALSIGATAPAMANNTNGSIQGTSIRVNGSSISNVTITIENLDTGLTRSVQSDESGDFRFPLLPAGNYKVTAEKNGFRTTIQDSVKLVLAAKQTSICVLQVMMLNALKLQVQPSRWLTLQAQVLVS